jgi:hypothetical protein
MDFVISAPRSGSTWLAQALNHHPELFATEQRLFGEFCQMWPNNDGSQSVRITADAYARAMAMHFFYEPLGWSRREFIDRYLAAHLEFLESFATRHSGKPRVVDKITPYEGTAGKVFQRLRRHCAEARLVLLRRDGRDVAVSGVFDWIARRPRDTPEAVARHAMFVEQKSGARVRRFFDDELLASWCRQWTESLATFDAWPRLLAISYEEMIADQAVVLRRVFQFLEVAHDEPLARGCADAVTFEKTTGRPRGDEQPLAKARKAIVGDWRNYFTRRDGELFEQLAGDQLRRWGYETNAAWVAALPDELSIHRE